MLPSPAAPLPTLQSAKSATYSRQHAALARQQCNSATHSSATCNAQDYRRAAGMRLQRWVGVTVGTTTYKSAAGKRRYLHRRSISARRTSRRPRTGTGLQRNTQRADDSRRMRCGAIGTTCRERARCLRESAVTRAAPLPLRAPLRADCDNVPCSSRGSGLGEATRSNEARRSTAAAAQAAGLGSCAAEASVACEPRPKFGTRRAGRAARTAADGFERMRAPTSATRIESVGISMYWS